MIKKVIALVVSLVVLAGLLSAREAEADSKTVKLISPEWSSNIAITHVVKAVLEMTGYKVKVTPVSAAAMWKGVANGDADAMVAAWLPTTHGHYLKKVQDKVENLGRNLTGTRIGLVVPKYVTIDSIDQLNANADKFGGEIVGIDPGAEITAKTEKLLREYNLDKIKLKASFNGSATMPAALKDAIVKKKWIVVTGWTPHWMFARWDLKYLKDPRNIYGGAEYISTIVCKGLKKDMPKVYKFLDNFNWTMQDLEQVMLWNRAKGANPSETARLWVKENKAKVKKWLAGTGLKLK